jgi:hypothetical protein
MLSEATKIPSSVKPSKLLVMNLKGELVEATPKNF